jgi:hypothetical protein
MIPANAHGDKVAGEYSAQGLFITCAPSNYLTSGRQSPSRHIPREKQRSMTHPQGTPQPHRSSDDELTQANTSDIPVSIELSKVQIDQVMRGASGGGGHLSAMLFGLVEARSRMTAALSADAHHHLSRSLLSGLLMLASLPRDGSYLGNAEVARLIGMNASTAHRYISTLVEVGLVERHPSTRRYRLAQ